jgi:hypothetical protein
MESLDNSAADLRELVPACSLSNEEAQEQRARYARTRRSVLGVEREALQMEIRFSPELDDRVLAELIETERSCCPFFEMSYDGARRTLTVGVADPEYAPALDAVASALGNRA